MIYSKKLKNIPNKIAIFLIAVYRFVFSPSHGILRHLPLYPKPSCVFYPTCSQYASACFASYPFFSALRKTIVRISRCHPGTEPQVDLP